MFCAFFFDFYLFSAIEKKRETGGIKGKERKREGKVNKEKY